MNRRRYKTFLTMHLEYLSHNELLTQRHRDKNLLHNIHYAT